MQVCWAQVCQLLSLLSQEGHPALTLGLHAGSAECEALQCFLSCHPLGYFVKKHRMSTNNLKNIYNVLLLCRSPSDVEVCFLLTGIAC